MVVVVVTLKFPMIKNGIDISVEDQPESRRTRTSRKLKELGINTKEDKTAKASAEEDNKPKKILMVEVENVVHEKFKNTEEVKVFIFILEK